MALPVASPARDPPAQPREALTPGLLHQTTPVPSGKHLARAMLSRRQNVVRPTRYGDTASIVQKLPQAKPWSLLPVPATAKLRPFDLPQRAKAMTSLIQPVATDFQRLVCEPVRRLRTSADCPKATEGCPQGNPAPQERKERRVKACAQLPHSDLQAAARY